MISHTLMRTLFVLSLLAVCLFAAPTLAQNLQVPAESDANQGLAATGQQVNQAQDDQEWLTAYMLAHTSGHGFWTGSSTERLPIERAVSAAAAEFRALRLPDA